MDIELGSHSTLLKTLERISQKEYDPSQKKYDPQSLASMERACLYAEFLDIVENIEADYDDSEVTDYFEDIKRAATDAYGNGELFMKSEHFVDILKTGIGFAQKHRELHENVLCPKRLHDFRQYTDKKDERMSIVYCYYCGRMPTAEDLKSEAARAELIHKLSDIYRSFPTIFFQPDECLDVLSTRASLEELNAVLSGLKERMPVIIQEHALNYQAKVKPKAQLSPNGNIEFALNLIENGSASGAVRPQRLSEIDKLNSLLAKIEV